jgi:hypothetical protein
MTGAAVGKPLKETLPGVCCPLLILLMGGTSSPGPQTAPFKSGMPILVPQLASLERGMMVKCLPLLILQMGGTLSPGPMTGPFESGTPRLALQLEIL